MFVFSFFICSFNFWITYDNLNSSLAFSGTSSEERDEPFVIANLYIL